MLSDLQTWMAPYLGVFGDHPWLKAVVVVFVFLILAWIFDKFISATLKKLSARTRFTFDDQIIEYFHSPIYISVILIGIALSVNLLAIAAPFESIIFSSLQTIAFIVWTVFLMRVVRSILRAVAANQKRVAILHPQTLPLFENIAMIIIVVLAVYVIFSAWNVDMTAWLASAGIVGIAVGFAAKDTLANLFSGVFIMADAPYKIGDFVVLETGERGEITHIGIRSTRMRTRDDIEITVPNSVMGNTKIINESGGPEVKFRIRVVVGVAYGSDIDKVREILMDIALADENVCEEPEPRVRFRQFGASSLDFELLCWIEQPVLRGRVLDILNSKVYKRFIEENIEIPYSKHDLYIKQMPDESKR
ncbi:MAG: mechanosensitive ion channel family protein [Gammaproteobacteria bacterium]|nr:mechanosensitive ion channel family protein [Gammaproteobacteria bacterium]MDH3858064.1 mechanosensitive ion channel family protein [Gammaproteobacteria bacterium]